ncbi:MAG TPA: maleylpyruvate isomerase N-terminal domain-containing protein [Candidatus Limnocylindrales bacterium]|nr:maleylpyruvate isomerase N-terminal domain-containing protein [Candidatus Limnocylindrales bacterium]
MYTDALSFLEDERDAWAPYGALSQLSDDELERPVEAAHGWSGRDLMGHLLTWQLLSLDVAKELALGERSITKERADADWAERGGDVVNAEAEAAWRARPIDEIRQEFARVAGELRGFLTVVPETRWLKNTDQQRFFYEETTEHYEEHAPDLAAILATVGST